MPETPVKKVPWAALFWALFAVIVIFLFIINGQRIRTTIEATNFFDRVMGRLPREEVYSSAQKGTADTAKTPSEKPASEQPPTPAVTLLPPEGSEPPFGDAPPLEGGLSEESAEEGGKSSAREGARTLYFVLIDKVGDIYTKSAVRTLGASKTPLADSLNALLSGPTPSEAQAGFSSLIPAGSRLLSAEVRDGTAFLNFNENFMFNENGAEGYIYQLRQVVYTATEFPTVQRVQVLIEGRKLEYLGENIPIGTPISRNQ